MNEDEIQETGWSHASVAERVTNPLRIGHILNGLMESRALLTVSVPGLKDPCISVIFRIEPDQRAFLIDELTPKDGHDALIERKHLGIHAMLHGVHVYFRADVSGHGEEGGLTYYRLPFPDTLLYEQKRDHYRVYVNTGQGTLVGLPEIHGNEVSGRLFDLSVGGAGIRFPSDATIRAGMLLHNAHIDLPGEGRLDCSLEVRHTHHVPTYDELHAGTCFVGLQGLQERAIQRCVRSLERESRRRQTDGL